MTIRNSIIGSQAKRNPEKKCYMISKINYVCIKVKNS